MFLKHFKYVKPLHVLNVFEKKQMWVFPPHIRISGLVKFIYLMNGYKAFTLGPLIIVH